MKIPNIVEILHAWKVAANPTVEQQEIAEHRASICDSCEFKKFSKLIHTHVCDACGCPLSKKIYSQTGPSACPKEKWTR